MEESMTINPRDYDLRELRRMANPNSDVPMEIGRVNDADAMEHTPDEVLRLNQRRELLQLQLTSEDGESAAKPYLDTLPKGYAAEVVVFEWLDYLVNQCGFKMTTDALKYYETVGWTTESVTEELRSYMRGFSEVESFDPDKPGPFEPEIDDHALSLLYVARLASMQ